MELQIEVRVERVARRRSRCDAPEGELIRHDRGDQDLGGSRRGGIVGFVPNETRLPIHIFDLVRAFTLEGCDLQRLDVHGRAGHGLNVSGEGQCDRPGRALVVDTGDLGTLASVELRRTHGNIIAHRGVGVRMEIVDDQTGRSHAGETGQAGKTKIDAVGETAEGACHHGTLVLEVVGLEVVGERHLAAQVIEREAAGDADLVQGGDLLGRDISADEKGARGNQNDAGHGDGDEDFAQRECRSGLSPRLTPLQSCQ